MSDSFTEMGIWVRGKELNWIMLTLSDNQFITS